MTAYSVPSAQTVAVPPKPPAARWRPSAEKASATTGSPTPVRSVVSIRPVAASCTVTVPSTWPTPTRPDATATTVAGEVTGSGTAGEPSVGTVSTAVPDRSITAVHRPAGSTAAVAAEVSVPTGVDQSLSRLQSTAVPSKLPLSTVRPSGASTLPVVWTIGPRTWFRRPGAGCWR